MKKFRKVLDGLTVGGGAGGGTVGTGSVCPVYSPGSAGVVLSPRDAEIPETLTSEHFHVCKYITTYTHKYHQYLLCIIHHNISL
ncbi:hypothetical protein GDO86_020382 [Hymenochirus boettgeri]|uniref:Uncharacterized protein n=1 Tax=Hymenochirus boettgeri TaxID=247094 RepID=A0A8T2IEV6_9PIPI|nr:hypothetical protein GDO86_020382 [Hymenochirus boettgeri]